MADFVSQVYEYFELGVVDESLSACVDQLASLYAKIEKENMPDEFERLTKTFTSDRLLDQLSDLIARLVITSGDCEKTLFPVGMSKDARHKRYRSLIRIFHPDKGVKEPAWLNHKAEILNRAFNNAKNRSPDIAVDIIDSVVSDQRSASKTHARKKSGITYNSVELRQLFGDASTFRNRFLVTVFCVSALMIGGMILSTVEFKREVSPDVPLTSGVNQDGDDLNNSADIDLTDVVSSVRANTLIANDDFYAVDDAAPISNKLEAAYQRLEQQASNRDESENNIIGFSEEAGFGSNLRHSESVVVPKNSQANDSVEVLVEPVGNLKDKVVDLESISETGINAANVLGAKIGRKNIKSSQAKIKPLSAWPATSSTPSNQTILPIASERNSSRDKKPKAVAADTLMPEIIQPDLIKSYNPPLTEKNRSSREVADEVLEVFAQSYNAGTLEPLINLFDDSLVYGERLGKTDLLNEYIVMFERSNYRHVKYHIFDSYKKEQGDVFIKGSIKLKSSMKNTKKISNTNFTFDMQLKKIASDFKIVRYSWVEF